MKLFFFDTETTGLDSDDEILQFGAIYGSFDGKIFHEEHRINQYINVKKKSRSDAEKVHGISKKMIEKYGYLEEYIDEFLEYIDKSDYIIGHNLDFDVKMLEQECDRIRKRIDWGRKTLFCTMKSTTDIVRISDSRGGYKRPKLQELHKHLFGKEFEEAHDAMADIEATKNCFIELIKSGEIVYLRDLNDTGRDLTFDIDDEINNESLIEASGNGDIEKVKKLLDHGADIHEEDKNGRTALARASFSSYSEIIELLLEHGADINSKDKGQWTPLFRACKLGHKQIVELLLYHGADMEIKDNFGRTALMEASNRGYKDIVELLLQHGAEINSKDSNGQTALIKASYQPHKEVVKLLLDNGADMETKDNNGFAALILASIKGHKEIIKLLLEYGADINSKDNGIWTALMYAIREKHNGIVEFLLKNGAKLNEKQYASLEVDRVIDLFGTKEEINRLQKE